MDGELSKLLAVCKAQHEVKAVSDAFNREAAGKATILDNILLDRKRKEAGIAKPTRARQPVTKQSVQSAISIIDPDHLKFDPAKRPPITRYPLLPIEKTSLYKPPRTAASQTSGQALSGTNAVGMHKPAAGRTQETQIVIVRNGAEEALNAGAAAGMRSSTPSVQKRSRRRRRKKSGVESSGAPGPLKKSGQAVTASKEKEYEEAEASRTHRAAASSPSPPPIKRNKPRPSYDGFPDYSDDESVARSPMAATPRDTSKWIASYGSNPGAKAADAAEAAEAAAGLDTRGSPIGASSSAAAATNATTRVAAGSTATPTSAEPKTVATAAAKAATVHFIDYGKEERESKRNALEATFRRQISIDDDVVEPDDAASPPAPPRGRTRGATAAEERDNEDDEDEGESSEEREEDERAPSLVRRRPLARRRVGNEEASSDEGSEDDSEIGSIGGSVSGGATTLRNVGRGKATEKTEAKPAQDVGKSRTPQLAVKAATESSLKTAKASGSEAEDSLAATRQPTTKRVAALPLEGPRAPRPAEVTLTTAGAVAASAQLGPTATRGSAIAHGNRDDDPEDEEKEEEEDSDADTDDDDEEDDDDGDRRARAKSPVQPVAASVAALTTVAIGTSHTVSRKEGSERDKRTATDIAGATRDGAREAPATAAGVAQKREVRERKTDNQHNSSDGVAKLPPIKQVQLVAVDQMTSSRVVSEAKLAATTKKSSENDKTALNDGRGKARLSPLANSAAVATTAAGSSSGDLSRTGSASRRIPPNDKAPKPPPLPPDSAVVSTLADRLSRLSRSRSPTPDERTASASRVKDSNGDSGDDAEQRSESERPAGGAVPAAAPLQIAPKKTTRFQEGSTPPQAHNPAAAARGRRRGKKRDLEAYVRALEQIVDSSLQYIIASTGEKLGIEQPLTVAKAKEVAEKRSKATKKLKPSVVKKFLDGKYSKKVDEFLASAD